MRYVTIDIETANARYHSICQVGLVIFEDGREIAAERVMIDPSEPFSEWNTRIHGLREEHVRGAERFADRHAWLAELLRGNTVVSHSHFDRAAISQACALHSLPMPKCPWVDSMQVAMAVWPQFGKHGFGLRSVAGQLGIRYKAHDALEDARAAGLVIQRAMAETGLPLPELLRLPITLAHEPKLETVRRVGDGSGALVGETIVFTGELSVDRGIAADMAAEAGGDVGANVTKKTTMLVVGRRDLEPGWHEKSSKQRKAEEYIAKGFPIRIVGEDDFLALAAIKD